MRSLLNSLYVCILVAVTACVQEPAVISVTNITLDSSSVELTEGESYTLHATVSPSNADNQTVLWTSSNSSVATVNRGVVQAVSAGQATITATSDDGGKTATCTVTVKSKVIAVKSVSLDQTSLNLRVGDPVYLKATVMPENATNKNVSWVSSNESVASVNSAGMVNPLSAGTAIVSVITEDGGFKAQCEVVVTVAVTGIVLSQTTASVFEGESITLQATVTPADATDKEVIWKSSDPDVATVNDGKATGVKVGTAVITATTKDGAKSASCVITVTAHVQSISLDKTSLTLERGSSEPLKAIVLPENALNRNVYWRSSDNAVATVTDGVVTARGIGSAEITATTEDGEKTARCYVTVIVSVSSLKLEPPTLSLNASESRSLTLTISPSDATERDITWSSSSPSVATVKDGLVTAVASGSTTITAKAKNGVSATCKVSVVVPVTGITVSPQTLVLEQYTKGTITASVQPSNATEKGITWTSSSPSVATVKDGSVEALSPGTATITATTVDGSFSASCSITVEKEKTKATSLSFPGNALFVSSGDSYTLSVSVKPEDAVGNFTWKSSNTSAVSVSGNGASARVSSNYTSTGYTTVTVMDQRSGLSASIRVYSFIESFSWNESTGETYAGEPLITIPVGGTHQLKYTSSAGSNVLNLFGNKSNFVFYEPTYVVSAPTNITLSSEGLVTGVKNGTTGIKPTGSIPGGGKRVYFKVASSLYESEYNDTKDYANTVPFGMPMSFSLLNTSDIDWFKLLMDSSASGYVSVTISVEYSGSSSLTGSESRLCKYSLYDSSMQQWGAGSFSFSNSSSTASTNRTVPAGPLFLKIYFDTSYDSRLCPTYDMTVKMTIN